MLKYPYRRFLDVCRRFNTIPRTFLSPCLAELFVINSISFSLCIRILMPKQGWGALFAVLLQSGAESCLPCRCHPSIDFLQQEAGYKSQAPWCRAGLWGTAGSPDELMNPELLPASPARLWKQTDIKGRICKGVRHLRMLLGTSQELRERPSVSCGTEIDSACP